MAQVSLSSLPNSKYYTRLETFGLNKHSSLFCWGTNDDENMLCCIGASFIKSDSDPKILDKARNFYVEETLQLILLGNNGNEKRLCCFGASFIKSDSYPKIIFYIEQTLQLILLGQQ